MKKHCIDMPLAAPFLPQREGGTGEPKKTLWIFGPGASRHLGFPSSRAFLRQTVAMVLDTMGRPNEMALDIGRTSSDPLFVKADGKQIANWEVRAMKEDPEVAFDHLGLLRFFTVDEDTRTRLSPLTNELLQLRGRLAEVGIHPNTAELLDYSPRDLARLIESADSDTSTAARQAVAGLSRLHSLAMLEFNERARLVVRTDWRASCYEQLVRKGVFDSNARIISFCCDTVLDEALFRRFRGCWSYDAIEVAGVNGTPMSLSGTADLRLIKPHGSLNMLWCPECGKVHIQWLLRYVAAGTERPATSARTCPHCGCRTDGDPSGAEDSRFLPALFGKQQLEASRDAVREAFGWAEQIIAVGYRFSTRDEALWPAIAEGLAANPQSAVGLWLVLSNQQNTHALRDHLLSDDILPVLRDSRFSVTASDLAGFEAV